MNAYDVAVIGAGGVGSAALSALARRGARVLGIDRFSPPHDRGSTHGDTRVIRLAYFEHPDYVPLLRAAYQGWARLEASRGQKFYEERGVVQAGPEDGVVVPGVLASARAHDLEVEKLSPSAANRRFPSLRVPANMSAVFEKRAGFLWVERCVEALLSEAKEHGAHLWTEAPVRAIRAEQGGFLVETAGDTAAAKRLVIAPGAWAPELLRDLGPLPLSFEVRRKCLFWLEKAADPEAPVFLFETEGGVFYGFPPMAGDSLKLAEHSGGRVVSDPLGVDRQIDLEEQQRVLAFARTHLGGSPDRPIRHATCLYTMTPDERFIVDRHPLHANAVVIAGLSGHGFKFASVLGEIAADLALDGGTRHPIDFLGLSRFSERR